MDQDGILVSLKKPESDMGKKGMFLSGLVFGPMFCNPLDSSAACPGEACWQQRLIRKQTMGKASYHWNI